MEIKHVIELGPKTVQLFTDLASGKFVGAPADKTKTTKVADSEEEDDEDEDAPPSKTKATRNDSKSKTATKPPAKSKAKVADSEEEDDEDEDDDGETEISLKTIRTKAIELKKAGKEAAINKLLIKFGAEATSELEQEDFGAFYKGLLKL